MTVSEPRERLLRTASGIFYAKGVHAVGVDEIVSAANVTRATFYRHFPGKDDLIVAYLSAADQAIRARTAAVVDAAGDGWAALRAIAADIVAQIHDPVFRGCAFLNAAAEYPAPEHPVHQAVLTHRAWFLEAVTEQFARVLAEPAGAARHVVMLRDGAMAAGCLADPDEVCAVFVAGVEGYLDALGRPAGSR